MKKNSVGWMFAVIILSSLLIVSVFLGMSGYFFSISYLNSSSDLVVGENVSIGVRANESSVVSFTLDGGYLPNELIPQVIQINAQDLDKDVRLRVKSKLFGIAEGVDLGFITTGHFEQASDGYYYFDDVLKGGNKVTFCTYVVIPSEIDLSSDEKYIFTIVVETLGVDVNYEEIWEKVEQL